MTKLSIKSAVADRVLFAGDFPDFLTCIETALRTGVSLRGADLRQCNLQNAELDGADLSGTDFTGANLTGANLSEALLRGADFSDAIMHGTILCESDLTLSRFDGTLFGATEIFGATFRDCLFSTLSAFTLRFEEAQSLKNSCFINPCGMSCPMSRPPLVIQGLSAMLVIMDHHIKIGHQVFNLDIVPDWIASGGLTPRNLRLRIEQILMALIMDDKRTKIA